MNNQITNIVIALIISGTALYGFGAFDGKQKTYATVNFSGGFIKIGEIAEQRAFSEFKVQKDGGQIFSGTAEEVIAQLNEASKNKTSFVSGVTIKGSVGVKWVGSESSFQLTTSTLDKTSTDSAPLKISDVIAEISQMNKDVIENHQMYADKAITFSDSPQNSFLLSRIVSALSK